MDWQFAVAWLVTLLAGAVGWVRANRQDLLLVAAEAVAFAEKYYWGAANETLEAEAVSWVEQHYPKIPSALVRSAVRELCRRRKVKADGVAPKKPPGVA